MTAARNPFEMFEEMFDRMSQQFQTASRSWESGESFDTWRPRLGFESMSLDLIDHDGEFVVTVDVPGFERDEIDVRVTDHTLYIEAEREESVEETGERYLRQEREHRSTSRSIRLPESVEADDITATMKNGVLTLTIPKAEPREEGREIEITVE